MAKRKKNSRKRKSTVMQSTRKKVDSIVEDPLLFYLKKQGLKYIDLRDRLGCLWIIGGLEISKKIRPLQKSGVSISFKPGGSTATRKKDAWWTTDRPDNLLLAEDIQVHDIPHQEKVPSDGRKAFNRWLATQYSNSGTVGKASWAVAKASEYAETYQLIQCSIFDIDDPNLLA